MLFISEYSETEWYSNIKGAIERVKQFEREIEAGTRDCKYRTGEQIRNDKIAKDGLTPITWFLTKDIGSTITCQATPNSRLASLRQNKVGQGCNGDRKQILEEGGHPVSLCLLKRDPFSTAGCKFKDPDCIFNPEKDCSLLGAVYIIQCNSCKA